MGKRIARFILEFLKIALTIVCMSWIVTIPIIASGFMIGYMVPFVFAVWALLALGVVSFILIPLAPGSAQGSDALIYFALPVVVPVLVLVPYLVGCIAR